MNPTDRLRHHVTGAIERGEKQAIVEQPADHVPLECRPHSITGDGIALFQRVAQRGAVRLEKRGMTRRGPSITSLLKKEFGMKRSASHDDVLARLDAEIEAMRAALPPLQPGDTP